MCKKEDCYLVECGYWLNKEKNQFRRNFFMPDFCCIKNLKDLRNNVGIFKTAYRYNTQNYEEAYLYGDFYLDFDSTDFELVRRDAIKALSYLKIVFNINIDTNCLIFFSGNKGLHIIIPAELFGIEPMKNLNDIYKTIASALFEFIDNKTLDLRIYDNKRMFRIPNSIHEVTKLHKVNISYDELRNSSYENIKEIATGTRKINNISRSLNHIAKKSFEDFIIKTQERINEYKNIKSTGTLKYTPPCITEILENGALNGQRNNTIAIIASYFKATGLDLESAISKMTTWNEEKTANPVSNFELLRTTQSIYTSDKQFGCSAIKDLGLCSKEYCKFKK